MKIRLLVFFFMLSSITYAQNFDINDGLVAYYPFNGNANDESKNNNHGKVYGAELTADRFGNKNHAYYFDGISDWIEIKSHPSIEPTDQLTIVAWFKPQSVKTEWNMVITKRYHDRSPWHSYGIWSASRRGNKWSGGIRTLNGGCSVVQKEVPKLGKWTQFICTYDGKKMKLYVDGVLNSASDCNYTLGYSNMPLRIGTDTNRPGNKFHGIVDDIRIYNRALSECEIELLNRKNSKKHPKEVISSYILGRMSVWKQKDEYETTKEHEERINSQSEAQRATFEKEIIDEVAKGILWQCGTKKYDADKEAFTLTFNNVEPFLLKVPRSEARQFGDNFAQLEYLNPSFSIGDAPNLIVGCMEIKNSMNGKTYKYGCEPAMVEIPKDAVKVNSKTVTVKMWDDAAEDGDIVSVFLNDVRIKKEITVKKNEHIFTIELKEGVNTFKLLAHNEGKNPPNTAAILIDDGVNEHQRILSSKKGDFAELTIVLE